MQPADDSIAARITLESLNMGIGSRVRRFFTDENGATAVEYGLIAAGISVAIIVAVQTLGTNLNTTFGSVSAALSILDVIGSLLTSVLLSGFSLYSVKAPS